MGIFDELSEERRRQQEQRDQQHFAPGELERHEQAQSTIKQLYAALTAGQKLAEGPAVRYNREPKIEHWFQPVHVENRIVDDEAFVVFVQLGDSDALRVVRAWFEVHDVVGGVVADSPRETVIRDYVAWPDSEPSKIVHESTLALEAKLIELAELQQMRAAQGAAAGA